MPATTDTVALQGQSAACTFVTSLRTASALTVSVVAIGDMALCQVEAPARRTATASEKRRATVVHYILALRRQWHQGSIITSPPWWHSLTVRRDRSNSEFSSLAHRQCAST